jgi:hypothetical protein
MANGSLWADRVRLTAGGTVALATTTINLDTAAAPGLAQYGITSGAAGILQTITAAGAKDGDTLRLVYNNAVINVATGGNIKLPGGRTVTLAGAGDEVTLVFNGTNWVVTGYQQVSGTTFASTWCAFAATTGSSLVTTTNLQVLAETAFDVTYGIPANSPALGTSMKIVAMATSTTANGGSNAYFFKMRIGPTSAPLTGPTIAASLAAGSVLVANGFVLIVADLTFRAIGGAGTFTSSSRLSAVLAPAVASTEVGASLTAKIAQAIDTTVALSVVVSVSTGGVNASGTESTRLDQLTVFQA